MEISISCFKPLAVAYKNIGDYTNARLYLEKSIELSPHYFQAHRNLSSLINYKVNNKHLIQMESFLNLYRDDIDLNFSLSKAYKDINSRTKYFKHLETANKLKKMN